MTYQKKDLQMRLKPSYSSISEIKISCLGKLLLLAQKNKIVSFR